MNRREMFLTGAAAVAAPMLSPTHRAISLNQGSVVLARGGAFDTGWHAAEYLDPNGNQFGVMARFARLPNGQEIYAKIDRGLIGVMGPSLLDEEWTARLETAGA